MRYTATCAYCGKLKQIYTMVGVDGKRTSKKKNRNLLFCNNRCLGRWMKKQREKKKHG